MDISVITVSWNVKERLFACIDSVLKGTIGLTAELFVVDNASSDASAEMVAEQFPQVYLIRNEENRGFATANNQALKQAKGEYLLLLNPDMHLEQNTLPIMVQWMAEHSDVGVTSCKLVTETGETMREVRRFPTLWSQIIILCKLSSLFPKTLAHYHYAELDLDKEHDVDQVRGSFFMIRRACLEQIGLFDEKFFLWFEEVDFCKRAKNAGWRVVYTPIAQAVDYKGQSFKQVSRLKKRKWYLNSLFHYFRKHGLS